MNAVQKRKGKKACSLKLPNLPVARVFACASIAVVFVSLSISAIVASGRPAKISMKVNVYYFILVVFSSHYNIILYGMSGTMQFISFIFSRY